MFDFLSIENAKVILKKGIIEVAQNNNFKVRLRIIILNIVIYCFILQYTLTLDVLCKLVGFNKYTIINWLKKVVEDGFSALQDKFRPGRPRELNNDDLMQLKECITDDPRKYGYRVWGGIELQDFIKINYGIVYSVRQCQRILREYLELSFIVPRLLPANAKLFYKERELYKYKIKNILELSSKTGDLVVCQDEAHFKLITTVMRIWAEKGSKPIAYSSNSQLSISLSGFAVINTGVFFANTTYIFNYETFIQSIRDFIAAIKPSKGQKIYFVSDNAGYHKKAKRLIKENLNGEFDDINEFIVFVYLPPYSPDLNPIELVWKLIRRNVTHNRYFRTLEELEAAIFEYLKSFESPNELLKKLLDFDYNYDEEVVEEYLTEISQSDSNSQKHESKGIDGCKERKTDLRSEFLKESGIEPNSAKAKKLLSSIRNAEKILESRGINPYSAKGKVELKTLLTAEFEAIDTEKVSHGRPKSADVIEREKLICDADFVLDSPAGKKLNRVLRECEKALREKGIEPYSPEGKSQLQEFINTNRESFVNVKSKKGVGRKAGAKNKSTLEREDFLRSFGIDPNSSDGNKIIKKLRAEEKTLKSNGIDPYSSEGKEILQEVINAEIETHPTESRKSGNKKSSHVSKLDTKRRELIRSIGIDPDSTFGQTILKKLLKSEKIIFSANSDPYSSENRKKLLEFMKGKLYNAVNIF